MIPPIMVHCGVGLSTAGLAIPLVIRKVPMNRVYGVRIAKAFASDRDWYEINAYGGERPPRDRPVLPSLCLLPFPPPPPPAGPFNGPLLARPPPLVLSHPPP